MQLFIADFSVDTDRVVIHDLGVLEQMRKVLRMKKGAILSIQNPDYRTFAALTTESSVQHREIENHKRYVVRIDDWDHTCVYGTITQTVAVPEDLWPSLTMYVAMPNKRDKAELIVQKLAELWVGRIVFWVAERSVLRKPNDNKIARMQKIIREAVEQSWGWYVPNLSFQMAQAWVEERELVIFDKTTDYRLQTTNSLSSSQWQIGVVGPEGGLTQSDYAHFPHHIVSSLGNTILRMETAAIVGAYNLLSSN